MSPNELQKEKGRLISTHVIPYLAKHLPSDTDLEILYKDVYNAFNYMNAIDGKVFESDGTGHEGNIWVVTQGSVQVYCDDGISKELIVIDIYKQYDVILTLDTTNSTLGTERLNNYEMLEAGNLLYISHSKVKDLITKYPTLHQLKNILHAMQEKRDVRIKSWLVLGANAKVEKFAKFYPRIVNLEKQQVFASFLCLVKGTFCRSLQVYRNKEANVEP